MSASSPLDRDQVKRAVASLLKYVHGKKEKSQKKALLDDAEYVLLSVGLQKIPEKGKNKPYRIIIPNPIYDADQMDVCMFVKDSKEIKKRLEERPVACVKKVLSLKKLRSDYKDFEAKRKLCSSYDMFLCQDSILPMMPKAIGKKFFVKKKQPIPLKCTSLDLGVPVRRALDSTYLYLGWGSSTSVRIGITSMSEEEIVSNIIKALDGITLRVPKKWRGIRSLHIKTGNSVALPIFGALPDVDPVSGDENGAESTSSSKKDGKRKKPADRAEKKQKQTRSVAKKKRRR
eukprot:g1436.t1